MQFHMMFQIIYKRHAHKMHNVQEMLTVEVNYFSTTLLPELG